MENGKENRTYNLNKRITLLSVSTPGTGDKICIIASNFESQVWGLGWASFLLIGTMMLVV
jgi:hypothetical protein